MSKSPNKKNISLTEHQVKALQEWLFLLKVLDETTDKILNALFDSIRAESVEKAVSAVNADTRLPRCDENIYNCYKHLMNYYGRTVEMYNENKNHIANEKIIKIFEGINSIILSRLKLFEEKYGHDNASLDANPITIEKNQIINNHIKLYNKNFDGLVKKFLSRYMRECRILSRQNLYENMNYERALAVTNQLIKISEDCLAEGFYKIYEISVKNAISNLNDLQLRKVTSYYYDILKEEQEILSTIIKVQVNALETEVEKNESTFEEKTVLFNMLSNFREGYQYLGKEINEIMECFLEIDGKKPPLTMESFDEFLEDFHGGRQPERILPMVVFDDLKLDYDEKIGIFSQTFSELVKIFLDKELNTFNMNKSVYETKKAIAENLLISDEMEAAYKKAVMALPDSEDLPKELAEIIRGINETTEIKLETLAEAKTDFTKETAEVLSTFDKDKIRFTSEDKELAVENAFEIWKEEMINCPPQDFEAMAVLEKIFAEILKCDTVFTYRERLGRNYSAVMDSLGKKITAYKRDCLLFEVSTFEEIMMYSVSRLRESEHSFAAEYTANMDKVSSAIENILRRNNIELIRPQPHEPFNAREHDILLAEKNEAFAKGEIIKTMNCGYRQNEQVILRANVIAAK